MACAWAPLAALPPDPRGTLRRPRSSQAHFSELFALPPMGGFQFVGDPMTRLIELSGHSVRKPEQLVDELSYRTGYLFYPVEEQFEFRLSDSPHTFGPGF